MYASRSIGCALGLDWTGLELTGWWLVGWLVGAMCCVAVWCQILQFCFATTSFLVVTSFVGFYGTRRADDVHEERGRNYALFLYFVAVMVGTCIIAVQVDFAKTALDTVNGCEEPYATEPDDCPLQLVEWIDANPSEWRSLQHRWECCGLDPYDRIAMNPALNVTCPPSPPEPPGCRHEFLTTVFTACVAIIAMSSLMLMSQLVSAVAACCLFSCKFPDRTVEGWSVDGHAFQVFGQRTPGANAGNRRNANPNQALLGVNASSEQ